MSKVAIVTGGASGIGLALTKSLVLKGYRVAIADWNEDLGRKEASALGENAFYVRCDVSSWESQVQLFETTKAKWGRIDVVIANAGVAEKPPPLAAVQTELTKPDTSVVDVAIYGSIYSLKLAIWHLRQNKGEGGKIIATASQAGIYPFPSMPIHAGTKAAIINMCRSIAEILGRENIHVNVLCPGMTITPVTLPVLDQLPKGTYAPMENHVKCVEQFVDTDIYGAVMESDAAGLYNREAPKPWSPEKQAFILDQLKGDYGLK